MSVDPDGLRRIAEECAGLVESQFGRQLDWTVDSLAVLDEVCAELLAGGPLAGERLDLWWKLVGAYTGEVLVREYGGQWIAHERAPGAYAVTVSGTTAFPFAVTHRVLSGEPYKSLASFARVLPAVVERSSEPD
ncbi:MAG: hypothetical protein ACJ73S_04200 [Mycobacteriales bacterium]